jgi:hypothetical protein
MREKSAPSLFKDETSSRYDVLFFFIAILTLEVHFLIVVSQCSLALWVMLVCIDGTSKNLKSFCPLYWFCVRV